MHGEYSIRSFTDTANKELYGTQLDEDVVDFIWQHRSPPRDELLKFFIALCKLQTGSLLHNLNIISREQALYLLYQS